MEKVTVTKEQVVKAIESYKKQMAFCIALSTILIICAVGEVSMFYKQFYRTDCSYIPAILAGFFAFGAFLNLIKTGELLELTKDPSKIAKEIAKKQIELQKFKKKSDIQESYEFEIRK